MRARSTPIVAIGAALLLFGGSAAKAIPSAAGAGPRPISSSPAKGVWAGLRTGRVSFRPVGKGFPDPTFPVAQQAPSSIDAFGPLPATAFAAYSTGTVLHSDPELSGTKVAVTVDMATSDAAYAAQSVSAFADELGRPIVPGLVAGSGRAQARAVKLEPPDAAGDIDTGEPAESQAPPTNRPVVKEVDTDLTPILKAKALRAAAAARAVPTGCVVGDDLARADASADDTAVADTDPKPDSSKPLLSLSADEPPRAVSHSLSRTRLVPLKGRPGLFGAVAETRQTIAPITFGLPGTGDKFTIEVAGEWVMRATADGTSGTVSFGHENANDDDRPALRLIHGKDVVDEVGVREIGGRTGIFFDGQPVGDIRIGADSRAVRGPAESKPIQTATRVSAAADAVVVRLFEPHAELHIGHMEVGLAVPVGGIQCPGIQMTKASDRLSVQPGEPFSWNIAVSNPNDCVLDRVVVTDVPAAGPRVDWKALTSVPRATSSFDGSLIFDAVGPIGTGETRTLQLNAEVEPGSAPGTITNRATAAGVCGDAAMSGSAEATTGVGGLVPALPRPAPGFAGENGRASQGASAAGSVPATPVSATRSGSATQGRTAGANAGLGTQTGGSRAAAGPLARSGSDSLPYLELATALIGCGRILRRLRARRRSA